MLPVCFCPRAPCHYTFSTGFTLFMYTARVQFVLFWLALECASNAIKRYIRAIAVVAMVVFCTGPIGIMLSVCLRAPCHCTYSIGFALLVILAHRHGLLTVQCHADFWAHSYVAKQAVDAMVV